jgi:hypothetical protein
MRLLAAALICALAGGAAFALEAKNPNECVTVAAAAAPDFGLSHVSQAIRGKKLDVAVIGSASSELSGPGGVSLGYPVRLELALSKLLPGIAVKVSTYAKPRDSAAEMAHKITGTLNETKPALVVWQTGTADAVRGIDPDDFRMALDQGVDRIEAAKADLIMMNMQYSPRTEVMLAQNAYADVMRMISLQREVVLFDRLTIMRRWYEGGVFDLYGATRNTDIAERVHDCLGRLLANTVIAGAKLAPLDKNAR